MADRAILIASADRLFAEAAAARLSQEEGWRVDGTALDGLQALAAIGRLEPHAVLVIGQLPRLGPAALARQVRRRWPETTVVVVGDARTDDATVLHRDTDVAAVLSALVAPPVPTEAEAERPDGVMLLRQLTRRERLILTRLAEGRTMPEIAQGLGVSEHTVRTHMQNLYAKLGVHNRLEVVRFAARHGLVSTGDESGG